MGTGRVGNAATRARMVVLAAGMLWAAVTAAGDVLITHRGSKYEGAVTLKGDTYVLTKPGGGRMTFPKHMVAKVIPGPAGKPADGKGRNYRCAGFNYFHETFTNPWAPEGQDPPTLVPKSSRQRKADFALMRSLGATAVRIHGGYGVRGAPSHDWIFSAVDEAHAARLEVWLSFRPSMWDLIGVKEVHPDEEFCRKAKDLRDLRERYAEAFAKFAARAAKHLRRGDVLVVANELPIDLGYQYDAKLGYDKRGGAGPTEQKLLERLLGDAKKAAGGKIELTYASLPLQSGMEGIEDWKALRDAGLSFASLNCYWSQHHTLRAAVVELRRASKLTVAVTEYGALTHTDAKRWGGDGRWLHTDSRKAYLAGQETQAKGVAGVLAESKQVPLRGRFLFAWDEPVDNTFGLVRTNCLPTDWSRPADGGLYEPYADGGAWANGCVHRPWTYVPTGKPALAAVAAFLGGDAPTLAILRVESPDRKLERIELWWSEPPGNGAAPRDDLDVLNAPASKDGTAATVLLYSLKTAKKGDEESTDDGKVIYGKPAADGKDGEAFRCLGDPGRYRARAVWADAKSPWIDLSVPARETRYGASTKRPGKDAGSVEVVFRPPMEDWLYEITDLGPSPFKKFEAHFLKINNAAQVMMLLPDNRGSVLWHRGQATPLREGAAAKVGFTAIDLNDAGAMCGGGKGRRIMKRIGGRRYYADSRQAFSWRKGKLSALASGQVCSTAYALNNRGVIAGSAGPYTDPRDPPPDRSDAVVWRNGRMTKLPSLRKQFNTAVACSDAGHVVGDSVDRGKPMLGWLWKDGKLTDLGSLGGGHTLPTAVNDSGLVVGRSKNTSRQQRAFLWERGRMVELGALGDPSGAADVNAGGQIVGYSTDKAFRRRAVVWIGREVHDMNDMLAEGSKDWALAFAVSINDSGLIVGNGQLKEEWRYFLATPVAKGKARAAPAGEPAK